MPGATSHKLLEVACFDPESCVVAEQAGADRVEFCCNYEVGGITPSRNDILAVRATLSIPLHVIIRPRPGNFIYTASELDVMRSDIAFCQEAGVDGVVFGLLNANHEIDTTACAALKQQAGELACTFHRAIDACVDLEAGVQQLIGLGFDHVLSSGGKPTAEEGLAALHRLNASYGHSISIMPGGGVRAANIGKLVGTGCREFHTAAMTSSSVGPDPLELKSIIQCLRV